MGIKQRVTICLFMYLFICSIAFGMVFAGNIDFQRSISILSCFAIAKLIAAYIIFLIFGDSKK